jgi:hypothetical protein
VHVDEVMDGALLSSRRERIQHLMCLTHPPVSRREVGDHGARGGKEAGPRRDCGSNVIGSLHGGRDVPPDQRRCAACYLREQQVVLTYGPATETLRAGNGQDAQTITLKAS